MTLLGTATIDGSGNASLAISTLSVGSHSIRAVYAGDVNFGASLSSIFTTAVNRANTDVSEVIGSNSSVFGQGVIFTATVSTIAPGAGAPAGTVSFYNGPTFIGEATLNGSDVATLATAALPVGSPAVTAVFDGSSNFNPSQSSYRSHSVISAVALTSVNHATFTVGTAASFTVTTSGSFTPLVQIASALPTGLTFHDNGDGTATIAGTPAVTTGGAYDLRINSSDGVTEAAQTFALTINEAASITGGGSAATFPVGSASSITFKTLGFPAPTMHVTGALPGGVTFTDNGNGTATLAGTPTPNVGAVYNLTVTASNGISSDAIQSFTLTVADGPAAMNSTVAVAGASIQFGMTLPLSATPPVSAFTLYTGDSGQSSSKTSANLKAIAGVTYNATTHVVSVKASKPLATNVFYVLTANASQITGANAIPLDGTGNGNVGTSLQLRIGIGKKLTYVDAAGNTVALKLRGAGTMMLVRRPDGQGDTLIIVGSGAGTVISGTVRNNGQIAQTTLALFAGLGQGSNQLPANQFAVAQFLRPAGLARRMGWKRQGLPKVSSAAASLA